MTQLHRGETELWPFSQTPVPPVTGFPFPLAAFKQVLVPQCGQDPSPHTHTQCTPGPRFSRLQSRSHALCSIPHTALLPGTSLHPQPKDTCALSPSLLCSGCHTPLSNWRILKALPSDLPPRGCLWAPDLETPCPPGQHAGPLPHCGQQQCESPVCPPYAPDAKGQCHEAEMPLCWVRLHLQHPEHSLAESRCSADVCGKKSLAMTGCGGPLCPCHPGNLNWGLWVRLTESLEGPAEQS